MPLLNSIISAIFKCFQKFFATLRVYGHFDFVSDYEVRYIVKAIPFQGFQD